MGLHRWLGAILITSLLGLTACTKPAEPTGTNAPATPATVASTAPTPEPVETAAPSATASASATPNASGTPAASASGAPAGNGKVEADYANAEGMAGYEEVAALTAPPSSPDSIAKGKEVFSANCATCHGADGHGDGDAGKALDPPPRNMHAKGDFKYGAGPHGVYRTVFYGVEGTGMAPLEGVLTPEQIWNVVHYVETLEGT